LLIGIGICFLPIISQAQQWLGIANSNYAGTNAIYVNPANVTDSRYKFYLNIAANDAFATNSYFGWNAPYSYLSMFTNSVSDTYRNAKGVIVYKDEYLTPNPMAHLSLYTHLLTHVFRLFTPSTKLVL
jgi:hypothetical protein